MNFQASVIEQASATVWPEYDDTWTKRNSCEFLIWGFIIFWSECSLSLSSFSISWLVTCGSEASSKWANFLNPVILQDNLIKSVEILNKVMIMEKNFWIFHRLVSPHLLRWVFHHLVFAPPKIIIINRPAFYPFSFISDKLSDPFWKKKDFKSACLEIFQKSGKIRKKSVKIRQNRPCPKNWEFRVFAKQPMSKKLGLSPKFVTHTSPNFRSPSVIPRYQDFLIIRIFSASELYSIVYT